jgi:hypothetical protein
LGFIFENLSAVRLIPAIRLQLLRADLRRGDEAIMLLLDYDNSLVFDR